MLKAPMLLKPVACGPSQALSAAASALPATMPTIMCGSRGHRCLESAHTNSVTSATKKIQG